MFRSVFHIELTFVCDTMKGVKLHSYAEDILLSVSIFMKIYLPVALTWSDIS